MYFPDKLSELCFVPTVFKPKEVNNKQCKVPDETHSKMGSSGVVTRTQKLRFLTVEKAELSKVLLRRQSYWRYCWEGRAIEGTVEKPELSKVLLRSQSYRRYCWEARPIAGTVEKAELSKVLLRRQSYRRYCWEARAIEGTVEKPDLWQVLLRRQSYRRYCWEARAIAGTVEKPELSKVLPLKPWVGQDTYSHPRRHLPPKFCMSSVFLQAHSTSFFPQSSSNIKWCMT